MAQQLIIHYTIPVFDYRRASDPKPAIVMFSPCPELRGNVVQKELGVYGSKRCRLSYEPNYKDIQEIEINEDTVIRLENVRKFFIRAKKYILQERTGSQRRSKPSDSDTVEIYDFCAEGILFSKQDLKKSSTVPDQLRPIKKLLLRPINIPLSKEFNNLLGTQLLSLPDSLLNSTGSEKPFKVPDQNDPNKKITLDLVPVETEYTHYWIQVLKIHKKMAKFFLDSTMRSESQWQATVYQPLFEATSLTGLVTGLNPFCTHGKITNEAFATSKFRTFACGPHALKPDIADGWFVMLDSNTVSESIATFDLNQNPFKGLEGKFGDCSHLLLDTVVEFEKNHADQTNLLKLVAELGVISSVLQYVTKISSFLTFGFSINKESVVLFVMRHLRPLKIAKEVKDTNSEKSTESKYKKEAEYIPEFRLQSMQLFEWDLKNETQYFEFAIFLWRLRVFRMHQQVQFTTAFYQQKYEGAAEGMAKQI